MDQLPAHVMQQPAPATRHQQHDDDDDRPMSPKPPGLTPHKSNSESLRTARQLKTASPMVKELTLKVQKPLQPPLRTHPLWLLLLPWPPFHWPYSTRRWKPSTRTLWHDLIGTIAWILFIKQNWQKMSVTPLIEIIFPMFYFLRFSLSRPVKSVELLYLILLRCHCVLPINFSYNRHGVFDLSAWLFKGLRVDFELGAKLGFRLLELHSRQNFRCKPKTFLRNGFKIDPETLKSHNGYI